MLGDLPQEEVLESSLLAVRHHLGKDFSLTRQDTEDRLLVSTPPTLKLPLNPASAPGPAVRLITFRLSQHLAFLLGSMGVDGQTEAPEVVVDCLAVHAEE